MNETKLSDILLVENIRENSKPDSVLVNSVQAHGILEPLLVRKNEKGKLVLIAGYRRYHAAKEAGLKTVPVRVLSVDEKEAKEIQVVENTARKDLTPFETLKLIGSQFTPEEQKVLAPSNQQKWTKETAIKLRLVASRFGLSPKSVLTGIRIAGMNKVIRAMADDNKLSLESLDLLARQTEETQEKFVERYKAESDYVEDSSVRNFISSNAERALKNAPFNTGNCMGCSFNTGMADLFGGKNELGSCLNAQCWNKLKAELYSACSNRVVNADRSGVPLVGSVRPDWNGRYSFKGKPVQTKLEGELAKQAKASAGKSKTEATVGRVVLKDENGKPKGVGWVPLKPEAFKPKTLKGPQEQQKTDWAKENFVRRGIEELVGQLIREKKMTNDQVTAWFREFSDLDDDMEPKATLVELVHEYIIRHEATQRLLSRIGKTWEALVKEHGPKLEAQYEEEKKALTAAPSAKAAAPADEEDEDAEGE